MLENVFLKKNNSPNEKKSKPNDLKLKKNKRFNTK